MTKEEIKTAREIVLTYQEIDSRIENLNDQLKFLNEKKNKLEIKLNETKKLEDEFIKTLEQKYGIVDYNEIAREIAG